MITKGLSRIYYKGFWGSVDLAGVWGVLRVGFRPGSRGFGCMRIGVFTRVVGFWVSIFELKDVWDAWA